MFEARIDFDRPFARNPPSLLQGERMIRGLQFYVRTYSVVSEMHTGFEILRARIERQLGGEPSEEWADVRPLWCVEASNELIEAVLAQRYPNAPNERLALAMHRNLQAATDEERLLIDNAGIAAQGAPLCTRFQRNGVVIERSVRGIPRRSFVPFIARRAFESDHCMLLFSPPPGLDEYFRPFVFVEECGEAAEGKLTFSHRDDSDDAGDQCRVFRCP